MKPLCIPKENWPKSDQQLWLNACTPGSYRAGYKPALVWTPKRRRIVEQGYGQWLAFLDSVDKLDSEISPIDRVIPELIEQFIQALKVRIAPWSLYMYVAGTYSMLRVMHPAVDLKWLRGIVSILKSEGKPVRDRRAHMVAPDELYGLGIKLMKTVDPSWDPYFQATQFRDGLMIAVLACAPMRIGNLLQISIGEELTFRDDRYFLKFKAGDTKTKTEHRVELPPELNPFLERYLKLHRQVLLARGSSETSALWINRAGKPMSEASIRAQINSRTKLEFGKHVWPHLARHIAASGIVDLMPEKAALIPDLLGHSSINTGDEHYILAKANLAHKKFQSNLLKLRGDARARRKGKGKN